MSHRYAPRWVARFGPVLVVAAVAGYLLGACGGGDGSALTGSGPTGTRPALTGTRPAETVVTTFLPRPRRAEGWGRALSRERLDTLLLEQARAAGATVLQPWSVEALEPVVLDYCVGLARAPYHTHRWCGHVGH